MLGNAFECRCRCHGPFGEHIKHCIPCCTQCDICGRNIKFGYRNHREKYIERNKELEELINSE